MLKINVLGEREVALITAMAEFKNDTEFNEEHQEIYIKGWLACKRNTAAATDRAATVAKDGGEVKLDRKAILEKVLSKEGMRRYRNGDSLNLDPTDLDEIAILAFEQAAEVVLRATPKPEAIQQAWKTHPWDELRADILHGLDGFTNEQTNAVLSVIDYYTPDAPISEDTGKPAAEKAGGLSDGINGPLTDAQRTELRYLYRNLHHLGPDAMEDVVRRASVCGYINGRKDFAPDSPAAAADAGGLSQTDLSKRLRDYCSKFVGDYSDLMRQAADEIDRYYTGMLAWKQTAEKKDADWNAERMGRVNDRITARSAAADAGGLSADDQWHSLTCDGTCSPPCKDAPRPTAVMAVDRNAVLEEAAKIADGVYQAATGRYATGRQWASFKIAKAIRALKSDRQPAMEAVTIGQDAALSDSDGELPPLPKEDIEYQDGQDYVGEPQYCSAYSDDAMQAYARAAIAADRAARTPASVESISEDAEFCKLAYAYTEAVITETVPATSKAWGDLVAYIDARSSQTEAVTIGQDAALTLLLPPGEQPQMPYSVASKAFRAIDAYILHRKVSPAASRLSDAYRAVSNCLIVVPESKFKRDMDAWLTARLYDSDCHFILPPFSS